jgi:hypothetical protein
MKPLLEVDVREAQGAEEGGESGASVVVGGF